MSALAILFLACFAVQFVLFLTEGHKGNATGRFLYTATGLLQGLAGIALAVWTLA